MRLLFDQNLSFKLCQRLADLYPDSNQARLLGLAEADDAELWRHAREDGFMIVTQDADFADVGLLQVDRKMPCRCALAPVGQALSQGRF